ncbi:MAG: ribonuclease III [Anaerolineales bacterium]|nr:ribonuclease III [Anaerolineales bacterium]
MPLPSFREASLLRRALTHRSYVNEHAGAGEDNERLEFLGDAVLDFLAGSFLYRRFPELDEGGLTRLRAALVNTESLAALAQQVELGPQLRLGKGEDDSGGRRRATLLCDGFEAVMGAYYLDAGLEAVRAYIEPLLEGAAKLVLRDETETDAKSSFQEWAQAARGVTPRYNQLAVTGPDHNREYTIEVLVGEESFGTGTGPNKQAATQAAARAALQRTLSQV